MDILERIEFYRIKRGWSHYKLAIESGLTQSTLSNMFTRKTLPSITTLSNICDGLGISLSEFFNNENKSVLANDELDLLISYRKLNEKQKEAVKKLCIDLA